MTAGYLALFDVDETLLEIKSMVSFLGFLERAGDAAPISPVAIQRFREASAQASRVGTPREQLNRLYYGMFARASVASVAAAGVRWYREVREQLGDRLFVAATRAALIAHAAEGAEIVLVSGSFSACLDPLIDELADWLGPGARISVLAARPAVSHGVYTGELDPPQTIGAGKRVAAVALIAQRPGIDLASCHAYGDHISDLPLLELVGHPHVIPRCPELVALARTRGWPVLSLAGHNADHSDSESGHQINC